MELLLPDPSLVVLVGPSGSGKTTFARCHFAPGEVLSSDAFRGQIGGDETDMGATEAAFDRLHDVTRSRLASGLLTVVDATNVQWIWRATLLDLARTAGVPAVAIMFDLPPRVLRERHGERLDRPFGLDVIRAQRAHLRRSLDSIVTEGFEAVWVLRSVAEVGGVVVRRRSARPPAGP